MSETSSGPIPGTGYALRQVVVATDLAALRGPVSGRWQLPLHLDASARAVYDLAGPDEREEAYQLVLLEAASPGDLEQWLDGQELCGCGPSCTYRGSCGPPGRYRSRCWPGPAPGRVSPSRRTDGDDRSVPGSRRAACPGSRDRYYRHGR